MPKWEKPKTMEEVKRRRDKFGPKLPDHVVQELQDLFMSQKLTNKLKREYAEKYNCDIKTIWRAVHKEKLRRERLAKRYGMTAYDYV